MTRSRVSLAALSALSVSAGAHTLLLIDTRHAGDSTDYKFVNRGLSNIGTDDAGPGAATTSDDKKPDGSTIDGDGTEQRAQQMQQAENAGGTQQANAADATDTGGAKTTVVGDPPAGSDQQQ